MFGGPSPCKELLNDVQQHRPQFSLDTPFNSIFSFRRVYSKHLFFEQCRECMYILNSVEYACIYFLEHILYLVCKKQLACADCFSENLSRIINIFMGRESNKKQLINKDTNNACMYSTYMEELRTFDITCQILTNLIKIRKTPYFKNSYLKLF